jgi:putative membrane protein
MEHPSHSAIDADPDPDQVIFALDRPDASLLRYYFFSSLLFGPAFPVVFTILYLRYRTLRYRFDEEGISMRWGALRRREINLTYARIQDIHVTSGILERWLGLARIQIQTASGSHKPEMTLEGMREIEPLRRFLEQRMRQERADGDTKPTASSAAGPLGVDTVAQLTAHLEAVTTELRRVREALERRDAATEARHD